MASKNTDLLRCTDMGIFVMLPVMYLNVYYKLPDERGMCLLRAAPRKSCRDFDLQIVESNGEHLAMVKSADCRRTVFNPRSRKIVITFLEKTPYEYILLPDRVLIKSDEYVHAISFDASDRGRVDLYKSPCDWAVSPDYNSLLLWFNSGKMQIICLKTMKCIARSSIHVLMIPRVTRIHQFMWIHNDTIVARIEYMKTLQLKDTVIMYLTIKKNGVIDDCPYVISCNDAYDGPVANPAYALLGVLPFVINRPDITLSRDGKAHCGTYDNSDQPWQIWEGDTLWRKSQTGRAVFLPGSDTHIVVITPEGYITIEFARDAWLREKKWLLLLARRFDDASLLFGMDLNVLKVVMRMAWLVGRPKGGPVIE